MECVLSLACPATTGSLSSVGTSTFARRRGVWIRRQCPLVEDGVSSVSAGPADRERYGGQLRDFDPHKAFVVVSENETMTIYAVEYDRLGSRKSLRVFTIDFLGPIGTPIVIGWLKPERDQITEDHKRSYVRRSNAIT